MCRTWFNFDAKTGRAEIALQEIRGVRHEGSMDGIIQYPPSSTLTAFQLMARIRATFSTSFFGAVVGTLNFVLTRRPVAQKKALLLLKATAFHTYFMRVLLTPMYH